MAAEPAPAGRPTVAVFASDRGPGDPERASIMSQAGSLIAKRGARLVCLAQGTALPVPLVTSARAAGGEVLVIADEAASLPPALAGVPVERIAGADDRLRRVAALADVFVGLPGSLASASDLYQSWARAGGGAGGKPVVLLNRNRAFEVVRGMAVDVLAHVHKYDRYVVFTDSVEDLWNKISWALSEGGQAG